MTVTQTTDLSFNSRILGMLYGVAFGDALGGPVEKLSARQIAEKYGRVTSIHQRWHRMDEPSARRNNRVRGNGIITDDTLMTLCLMEVYSELGRHVDAWDMGESLYGRLPGNRAGCRNWIGKRWLLSACFIRKNGSSIVCNWPPAIRVRAAWAIW